MADIILEQAVYRRPGNALPVLQTRSTGFRDDWLPQAERLILGFGVRPDGQACPHAVFAQPLAPGFVAIVQAADQPAGTTEPVLGFHVLVVSRGDYEQFLGDPFALAQRFPAPWNERRELPTLTLARQPLPPRTVDQVQHVLRRVKAGALKEDEDPTAASFERTADNSESPALLGGVQVLVDGGKLVFQRPAPDRGLVEGLWTLLPYSTRAQLWPASFAFDNTLGFDVLVVPRVHAVDYEDYTSEVMAADYPQGHYELSLQIAAETGDQRGLDRLLGRRSSKEMMKLAWTLLILMSALVLTMRILDWMSPPPPLSPQEVRTQAAAAVGMVGAGNHPWNSVAIWLHAKTMGFRNP